MNNIKIAKSIINENDRQLAFVVGNGINRYAYEDTLDVSWESLLLSLYNEVTLKTLSSIKEGMSYTEFYDIIEIITNESSLELNKVVRDKLQKWEVKDFHKKLTAKFQDLNKPVLTTNFDLNLINGLQKLVLPNFSGFQQVSKFYPWNVTWTTNTNVFDILRNFGVWFINGNILYPNSLKLGISQYINQSHYLREKIHSKNDYIGLFGGKYQNDWAGRFTWLHIIFNCDIMFIGLGLDINETFLRWLLIQRMKYFSLHREYKRNGWYLARKKDVTEGQKNFLKEVGIEVLEFKSFDDIYKKVLDIR